jgi:hypothetical protein
MFPNFPFFPTQADLDEVSECKETKVIPRPNKFKVFVSGVAITVVVSGFVTLLVAQVMIQFPPFPRFYI